MSGNPQNAIFFLPLSPLFFLRNYGELHNQSVLEEMELERIYFIIWYLDSFFLEIRYLELFYDTVYYIMRGCILLYYFKYSIFSVKFHPSENVKTVSVE